MAIIDAEIRRREENDETALFTDLGIRQLGVYRGTGFAKIIYKDADLGKHTFIEEDALSGNFAKLNVVNSGDILTDSEMGVSRSSKTLLLNVTSQDLSQLIASTSELELHTSNVARVSITDDDTTFNHDLYVDGFVSSNESIKLQNSGRTYDFVIIGRGDTNGGFVIATDNVGQNQLILRGYQGGALTNTQASFTLGGVAVGRTDCRSGYTGIDIVGKSGFGGDIESSGDVKGATLTADNGLSVGGEAQVSESIYRDSVELVNPSTGTWITIATVGTNEQYLYSYYFDNEYFTGIVTVSSSSAVDHNLVTSTNRISWQKSGNNLQVYTSVAVASLRINLLRII